MLPAKWRMAALAPLVVVSVLACTSGEDAALVSVASLTPAPTAPTAPPKPTPTKVVEIIHTPTPRPAPPAQPSDELIPTLSVSDSGCADDYERDEWAPSSSRWTTARQATARDEGPELVGYWTGRVIPDLSQADIDHHVPVKHAHMSGGCHWSEFQRNAFYTDLDNLNVTTQSMNRSKSDKAPGHWTRQNEFIDTPAERCEYAAQWINVKRKYELHFITARETSELTDMLSDCGKAPALLAPTRAATPVPEAAPIPTEPPATMTGAPGGVKVYKNCAELREDYPDGITKVEHPEVYAANTKRDRDKDGSACE